MQDGNADGPVLATLGASPLRRMTGVAVVGCLGLFLVWLAMTVPDAGAGFRAFMIAGGGLALYCALRLWHATAARLELTPDMLGASDGRCLAHTDDIQAVSRGTFAFKPSNGFVLTLSDPGTFAWAPGLWWRIGRRVGVGGVTDPASGRALAERIALIVAER